MKIKIEKPVSELKPLDVQCQNSKCDEGFHYYTHECDRTKKKGWADACKDCGDASIDWERIRKQDPADVEYTFLSLKKELLRHICWVNTLEETVYPHARRRGKKVILETAKNIISKKIGKIATTHFDKLCTPKKGKEIIHYGQHATATCCRKCLERWHNIPQDIVLNDSQIDYCVKLIEQYIDDRIPDLNEEPIN